MSRRSESFTFANSRGEELAGRLELPPGRPRAVALFAHCFTCSKNVVAASRISRALVRYGYAVLRFDFTGIGSSEGDFANTDFSSNVEDLRAAAASLRQGPGAPSLLVGHSLGGSAVLAAASDLEEVRAVATIGAPAEPAHVKRLFADALPDIEKEGEVQVHLGGKRFRITRQFLRDVTEQSLRDRLPHLGRALLIFHSPIDNVVGIDNARAVFEAARHPKSFISLDQADHLLTREGDADYVAFTLAAWASRYIPETRPEPGAPEADEGEVLVEEVGEGYAQRVQVGEHVLKADEPVSAGGNDSGPTPYDLLLAALGTCTSMTLRMYAERKEWPVEKLTVSLRHEKIHARDCESCETEDGKVDRIERRLRIEGDLDDEKRQRLIEIADRCPVHRTLTGEKEIRTRLDE